MLAVEPRFDLIIFIQNIEIKNCTLQQSVIRQLSYTKAHDFMLVNALYGYDSSI